MMKLTTIDISSEKTLKNQLKKTKDQLDGLSVDITYKISQNELEELVEALGDRIVELNVSGDESGNGGPPYLNYTEFKFPQLKSLSHAEIPIETIEFDKSNYPALESLSVEQLIDPVKNFSINLPTLKSMNFQFVCVDNPNQFGKSLSSSPLLESFSSYKLWGLYVPKSRAHCLVLPNCKTLSLTRSDDISHLKIWAPQVQDMDFRACFSLKTVEMLKEPPPKYRKNALYKFSGTESQYTVGLINTNFDEDIFSYDPRCLEVFSNKEEMEELLL